MKLIKKRAEERIRAGGTSEASDQRFRYPASEEISETSCRGDAQRWTDGDQPAETAAPDVAVAS